MPCLSTGSRAFARPFGGRLGEVGPTTGYTVAADRGAGATVFGGRLGGGGPD